MATQEIVWNDKLRRVWDKTYLSEDFNIYKTITQKEGYRKNMIKNDSSLTDNEKKFLLDELEKLYDRQKIGNNSVDELQCNNCQNWHQATQYCELCIRNYLENNFRDWTSGNDKIDKLIQECQKKTVSPQNVIEWINYDQFENIEHLTEGGCATIYTAIWRDGCYDKWNSEKQILERIGREKVILKRLNNSNSNNVHWFQEVTLSFTLDNTFRRLVTCFGLTKDPSTHDYMLVLRPYANALKEKMRSLLKSLYEEIDKQQEQSKLSFTKNENKQVIKNTQSNENKRSTIYKIQTSKLYTFDFSIQPKNATDEEQQAYETKQFDFEITE
ncbi:2410_t:CDS:2, partial [Dentiscutata erythropus]